VTDVVFSLQSWVRSSPAKTFDDELYDDVMNLQLAVDASYTREATEDSVQMPRSSLQPRFEDCPGAEEVSRNVESDVQPHTGEDEPLSTGGFELATTLQLRFEENPGAEEVSRNVESDVQPHTGEDEPLSTGGFELATTLQLRFEENPGAEEVSRNVESDVVELPSTGDFGRRLGHLKLSCRGNVYI
jgi:hypothetical protein